MALDGLGLVYEKQGNTGAAAYNQPSLQIGNTPLDNLAENVRRENLIKEREANALAIRREKEKAATLAKLEEIPIAQWDIDRNREIGAMGQALKNQFADYRMKGIDPNDYTNPDNIKYRQGLDAYSRMVQDSNDQKERFDQAYKLFLADQDSPTPQLDRDATIAKLNEYASAPSVMDRAKMNPSELLVRKKPVFDTYSPLKGFEVAKYGKNYGNESPEFSSSGTSLRKEDLKQAINQVANNPINDEHFQQGIEKGLWKTRDEYAKTLYDKAVLEFVPTSKYEKKAPKSFSIIDINNGNSSELISEINSGEQKFTVPNFDVNGTKKLADVTTTLKNVTQLGDFKATVNWASAINPSTGKPYDKKGNFEITSGAMALPLVKKGTNRILPTDLGSYTYIGDDKKQHTIKGDQETIEKELVRLGIAEYKPMVFGKTTDKIPQDVWIPAESVSLGATEGNKPIEGSTKAYLIYKKRAEDLNKATAKTYKVKGVEYSEEEIAQAAKESGMSIDEYLKAIGA